MTKIDEAKIKIIKEIKANELVIDAEFDNTVEDIKPLAWTFYRINIFYKNENGEATFAGKGVYIKNDGTYFLHSGGVSPKRLKTVPSPVVNTYACPAGGVCEYEESINNTDYFCKKCLKIVKK